MTVAARKARLALALGAGRQSIEAYGKAARAGIGVTTVAAWCRETDAELTAATVSCMVGQRS